MDPLSITASVAGIASAAGVVYQSIAKYLHEVRDAPREVDSLAAETRNLFGILNSLSLLVSTLEKDRVYAVLKDSYLNALRHTLYAVQLKLDRASEDMHRGSKRDAVLRRLRWPFSRSETKELLEEMTRHKDHISLALAADSMEQLLELLRAQNKTLQTMATLSQGMQVLTVALDARREIEIRTTLDAKRREVVGFFQAVNPQYKLEECMDLRQDMTGLWLLKGPSYQSWTEQPGQRIWLSGIPGSGKTILCGAIIQDVLQRSTPSTAVAFFFCDYAVASSHKPTQVLGSLAVQLALQSADAFAILEDYFDELHPPTGLAKPVRLADMKATMARLLLCFDRVFAVVDALDECKPDDVAVAEVLRDMAPGSLNVNMALLSRDEEPIRDVLEDGFQNIETAAHLEDLTLYIDAQMAVRKVFSSMLLRQPALYHDIRASLLKNAQGMFRWVACQLDYLEKLPSNGQRRKALDKLPGTLSQTYQRILENANENSDKATRDLVQRALHWIAISSPPLTMHPRWPGPDTDCFGSALQSPAPLASAIYEPGGLPFLRALEKHNGTRACLFRKGDPPPLIYASLATDVQIIQILRPYTDLEELFGGKTAAQHAIENFLVFPCQRLEAKPDSLGALLTPKLMCEACFDGRTLWEFACLYALGYFTAAIPSLSQWWFFDQEKADLLAQFKAYSTVLMSILPAGQRFADRNGVSMVAALVPLLALMHSGHGLKDAWDHLKPLAQYCSERVMESPNSRYSACLGLEEHRGEAWADLQYMIACVCVERDENNKAASLSYLLSMDLPEKVYETLAPNISIFDLAACTIDTFRRICQSLATADHRFGGYRRLSSVFWSPGYRHSDLDRRLLWRPCPAVPWPKTDDDATFAWTQTMTITFHIDSASQPGARQFRGCNLMHAAALVGMTFLVDFLLQNKVFDVNVLSEDACTPLLFAELGRNTNTAEYLVANGADPSLRSTTGLEPRLPGFFATGGGDVWRALFPDSDPPDSEQEATDAFRWILKEVSYASVPEPAEADR